jgi:hypothetical protein
MCHQPGKMQTNIVRRSGRERDDQEYSPKKAQYLVTGRGCSRARRMASGPFVLSRWGVSKEALPFFAKRGLVKLTRALNERGHPVNFTAL